MKHISEKRIEQHVNPEKFVKLVRAVNCYINSINIHIKRTGNRSRIVASLSEILIESYDDDKFSYYTTKLSYAMSIKGDKIVDVLTYDEEMPFCKSVEETLIGEAYILGKLVEEQNILVVFLLEEGEEYELKEFDAWFVEAFDTAFERDHFEFYKILKACDESKDFETMGRNAIIAKYEDANSRAEMAQRRFSKQCPICERLAFHKRHKG